MLRTQAHISFVSVSGFGASDDAGGGGTVSDRKAERCLFARYRDGEKI